jgi:hypothetical protein
MILAILIAKFLVWVDFLLHKKNYERLAKALYTLGEYDKREKVTNKNE